MQRWNSCICSEFWFIWNLIFISIPNQQVDVMFLDPDLPLYDLSILSRAHLFIGNCFSSFSSFVRRTRDADGKPTWYFGMNWYRRRWGISIDAIDKCDYHCNPWAASALKLWACIIYSTCCLHHANPWAAFRIDSIRPIRHFSIFSRVVLSVLCPKRFSFFIADISPS